MKATPHQQSEIERMAKLFWGDSWRVDIDAFCLCHMKDEIDGRQVDFVSLEELTNLQAAWLLDELESRVKSME